MIDLDKIEADAEAATPGLWIACDFENDFGQNKVTVAATFQEVLHPGQSSIWPGGVVHQEVANSESSHLPIRDATHIANCSPANIRKLLAVVRAADNYYRRYAQDEAAEDGCETTGCTLSQHEDALQLRNTLAALEAP